MVTFSERVRAERRRLDAIEAERVRAEEQKFRQQYTSTQPPRFDSSHERREKEKKQELVRRMGEVMGYAYAIADAIPEKPAKWKYVGKEMPILGHRPLRSILGWSIAQATYRYGYNEERIPDPSGADMTVLKRTPIYLDRHTLLTKKGGIAILGGAALFRLYNYPEDFVSEPFTSQQPQPEVLEDQLACFAAKHRLDPTLFDQVPPAST